MQIRETAGAQTACPSGYSVSIEASDREKAEQEREKKKEAEQSVKLSISESIQEMFEKQARERAQASEESGEKIAEYGKILEIARRIARGDKVPPRDEKKLMEYSAELYQMAKSAAMLNAMKKHKKHKSLFEEEEDGLKEKLRELKGGDGGAKSGAADMSVEASGEGGSTESEEEL